MSFSTPATAAWFPFLRERPGASVRLVCLPYAGGSARIFRGWPAKLPTEVEVCAVQPPGRESRLIERPYYSVTALANALADHLDALPSMHSILFGHSMGALIAFETTREIERRGNAGPIGLIVSAAKAPHLSKADDRVSHLDDDALVARIREMGGTPEEVLDNADLVQLLLPTIRADFSLCDNYRFTFADSAPVRAPLYALGAIDDAHVGADGVDAWRAHAGGTFRSMMVDGDHFFIDRRPQDFLIRIHYLVRECLLQQQQGPPATGITRTEAWTTAS